MKESVNAWDCTRMIEVFSVGDCIRDIEDGDCYYEGVVVSLNPFSYKVTDVVWNGVRDGNLIGSVTDPVWWYLKKV